MKNKFTKILSIGLVFAVLASLLVISTPASAGNMSWTKDTAPAEVLNKINGAQIVDMSVASNGTTGYAIDATGEIYKTTDGGATWVATLGKVAGAEKVAVAPDSTDGSFLAVITTHTATVPNAVYVSQNGGTTFGKAADITSPSNLNSIAISKAVGGLRSLLVAGIDTGNAAAVWYFATSGDTYGGGAPWQNILNSTVWPNVTGNVTVATTALTAVFSPGFDTDSTVLAVTANASATILNVGNTGLKTWNGGNLSLAGWGTGIAAGAAATYAEIAIPGSYYGYDAGTRFAYIASDVGLWRVKDTIAAELSKTAMSSVSLNAAGDKLVAGAAGSNIVYRVATPASATAAGVTPSAKAPGYGTNNNVTARFFGTNVGAATNGMQSAFALSVDDGVSFNDVAFVNDTTAVAMDFAVNADGSKYYLSTVGGGVASLWRKTTRWERVFKYATANYYIVRPAMDNFDVIYFAEKNGTFLWISNDAGQTTWNGRNVAPVVDLAAESASTLYILSGSSVLKSTNTFNYAPSTTIAGGNGNDLYMVAKDNLVVASTIGFAYTADGGTTWTSIAKSTGVNLVSATGLASGGKINAAIGADVYQFTVGTDTTFPTTAKATAAFAVNGLTTASGVTYAMSSNTTESNYLRSAITAAVWGSKTVAGTSLIDIKAAGGNLYSLATAGTDAGYIFKFTEVFAAAGPAVTAPADKFIVPINQETGFANNVVFQWTGIPNASPVTTTYNLQIALDSEFKQVVKDIGGIAGTLAIVGQTASGNNAFSFQADTTYYWRVRADAAFDSPWSATPYRTFKIDTLAPVNIVSPAIGASDVSVTPTFAWSPAAGATGYEIVVSDDPTFAIITFSRTTTQPVFATDDEQLAFGTVYYWRVRPTGPTYPAAGTAYKVGVFTTEARPADTTSAPPITITQTTQTITVTVPPPQDVIPPYILWIIIGIGAILVIALIVLIVRTRRVS